MSAIDLKRTFIINCQILNNMYSALRITGITGITEQLEKLLDILEKNNPDLSPSMNGHKDLVCDLSKNKSAEHWAEVADTLERVSESIAEAKTGDIGLIVDTIFNQKQLPGGGFALDTLSVSQIALEAMAKIGADFEATIYRPVADNEL